jgi:protein SCO1/2
MPPTPTGPANPRRLFLLAAGGGVLGACLLGAGLYLYASPDNDLRPSVGGSFRLLDGNGKIVTDADFRGKFMLVYFGYTFCPDVCPTTLSAIADAVARLGSVADKLAVIFITVDPKRDTPAVVKQYAEAFMPQFIGLTGTADAIADVAKKYGVYYSVHDSNAGNNLYTVDHTSIIYLMGPSGRFVAPIPGDASAEQIEKDLRSHLI